MAILVYATTLAILALTVAGLVLLRLRTILDPRRPKQRLRRGKATTHLLIVLGSGGHSAEMLGMLQRAISDNDESRMLNWRDYTYRTWVVGSGDAISARRAQQFEEMVEMVQNENSTGAVGGEGRWRVVTVPRAREIHQSMLTAPVSCLRCAWACWKALLPLEMWEGKGVGFPDLILTTGPATATILVFTSVLMRLLNIGGCNEKRKMRTTYVESWARVKKLSLSGKLMLWVVDRFFVQWPQLLEKTGDKGEYAGVLV